MSPKEKAEEIVNELFERSLAYHDACIAAGFLAEEIIKSLPDKTTFEHGKIGFWKAVQKEIENL